MRRRYTTNISAADPPSYDEALRLGELPSHTCNSRTSETTIGNNMEEVSRDEPPDYFDSVRERPAAPHILRGQPSTSMRLIDQDDNVNDAACLCAVFCIAVKVLSLFGH